MTTTFLNQGNDDPLQDEAFVAQLINTLIRMQHAMEENKQLKQRVEALETENAALTDTLEQWKSSDEWSNRVTYDNVVDQIASEESGDSVPPRHQAPRERAERGWRCLQRQTGCSGAGVLGRQGTHYRRQMEMGRCLLAAALGMQLPRGCQGLLQEDRESRDGHRC